MLVVLADAAQEVFILLEHGLAFNDCVKLGDFRNVFFDNGVGTGRTADLCHKAADDGLSFGIFGVGRGTQGSIHIEAHHSERKLFAEGQVAHDGFLGLHAIDALGKRIDLADNAVELLKIGSELGIVKTLIEDFK